MKDDWKMTERWQKDGWKINEWRIKGEWKMTERWWKDEWIRIKDE